MASFKTSLVRVYNADVSTHAFVMPFEKGVSTKTFPIFIRRKPHRTTVA